MSHLHGHGRRLAAVLIVALGASASLATAAGGRADNGTVCAGVTNTDSVVWVAGDIKDKILGRGAIVYQTAIRSDGAGSFKVTAKSVTAYYKSGTLSGTGYATQTVDAQGNSTVTNGHVKLTKGTGKLQGHSLVATFSGPMTNGVYVFKYKGTYK